MDVLLLFIAVIALWTVGLVLAVSVSIAAGRADRASDRGRWLAPIRSQSF
ncbi:MAG: hypothetical protein JWM73_2451 [Solirubrobacterales bacterium]|nr:hypothetical protein [Solirubrobacterales bacterium]